MKCEGMFTKPGIELIRSQIFVNLVYPVGSDFCGDKHNACKLII